MTVTAVDVCSLRKTFKVRTSTSSSKSFISKIKNFISPDIGEMDAVSDLTFQILPGERVAFLGPNGAGKSTTIKMLTGILHPTSGKIQVLDKSPYLERKALAYQIGTVFGQRTQLWHHLPAVETFELLGRVYDQDTKKHKRRQEKLIEIFSAGNFVKKPVRQLSLGEKMRCDLIASLLHSPRVLFLDEPTIGLDLSAKSIIRELIKSQSQSEGTTLLLTSHDTADVERVCDRVIVINQGKLLLDRSLKELRLNFFKHKVITLVTELEQIQVNLPGVTLLEMAPHRIVLKVETEKVSIEKVIEASLKASSLRDIKIEDPSLEEIIQSIYQFPHLLSGISSENK